MKKSLVALLLGLCLMSAPAFAGECFAPDRVTTAETKDGSVAVPMNAEETALFIKGVEAYFSTPQNTVADSAIVFTKHDVTRVVYFKDGCATTYIDLATEAFNKILVGA